MKVIIALLLLLGVYWVGKNLYKSYETVERSQTIGEKGQSGESGSGSTVPSVLPGLPASLETSLANAVKGGATGLRSWLNQYRSYVQDPRLASIELDYVVLISHQDPTEAQRIFRQVQERIKSSSPVYERLKRLEKTFQ